MAPMAWPAVFVARWVGARSADPLLVAESAVFGGLGLTRQDKEILVADRWEPDFPGHPPGKVGVKSCALVVVAPPA